MGKRIIVGISLLMIFFMIITGCQSSALELSIEDVKSMTIEFVNLPNDQCFTFTPDKHSSEIQRFIETINLAERIEKEPIPQPVKITLLLSNGKEIIVWGGKGGIQTINEGRKQYTIKCKELENYLTSLSYDIHCREKENFYMQTTLELITRLCELEQDSNRDKVVLKINGQEIRYKEYARHLIDKEITNRNIGFGVKVEKVDVDDIIKEITMKVVTMAEAERRGLVPTRQEVIGYIDWVRQRKEADGNCEDLMILIEKLGVSADEFWYKYQFEPNEYLLALQKLLEDFHKVYKEKNYINNQYEDENKDFDAYINQLFEDAEVEVIAEDLVFKNK